MGYLERRRGYSLRAATGLSAQSSTMALGETPANSFQRKRGVRHAFQGVEVRVVRLMVRGYSPPKTSGHAAMALTASVWSLRN